MSTTPSPTSNGSGTTNWLAKTAMMTHNDSTNLRVIRSAVVFSI